MQPLTVGFGITGSYCTFSQVFPQMEALVKAGHRVIPIMSEKCTITDTRFGKAKDFQMRMEEITSQSVLSSIAQAEPIGPKKLLDVLVVAPCTGNTIAKMANGIADTAVTLAVKSHLRNNRPVVVAISTNDGLSTNARNIGILLARKHIFFVPFGQDDCHEKENSLIAKFEFIPETIHHAVEGKQLQPILI